MRYSQSKKMKAMIAFAILFPSVLLTAFWFFDLRVNITASMPPGIWRVYQVKPSDPIPRDSVVIFCPPDTQLFRDAKLRGILSIGSCPGGYLPLMKTVVAIAGDAVEFNSGYVINGNRVEHSSPLRFEMVDPILERRGIWTVPPGSFWLIGTNSDFSFDSRYFGLVRRGSIKAVASPLLVKK